MNLRMLAPIVATAVLLTACSGGGSALGPSSSSIPGSQQTANGTLTIGAAGVGTAGALRKPAYVSPSTTYATLWIDASVSGIRQPCASTSPCTINWTSTSGPHTFIVEVDNSSSISGGGTVLADASESVTLQAGLNALSAIFLNGVPAQASLVGVETNCPVGIINTTCTVEAALPIGTNYFEGLFGVEDAGGNYIVSPGNFDGGGVCLQPSDLTVGASLTACAQRPDAFGNDYFYIVACNRAANGSFVISTNRETGPIGAPLIPQLATYGLSYPNQSSLTLNGFPGYGCSNGTIFATGPAFGPITVQSGIHKR